MRESQSLKQPASDRLVSLDALRGFDMFWIIGGVAVAKTGFEATGWPWLGWIAGQLHHTQWHGFTLYDLIFPLFLFMAGVAMPFSFEKRRQRGDAQAALYQHVIIRGLALVVLGLIYNGALSFDFANLRYASVLGLIGLAYLFAGLIVLSCDWRGQAIAFAAVLIGYWAALKFIPVPGFGAGDLEPGHTLTDYVSRVLLPGRLLHADRDPEGPLSVIPAIGTALAGALTGQLLKSTRLNPWGKTAAMIAAGLLSLGLAALWSRDFPINKNLWSSSFVLHCAGLSLLFLATFYVLIDVLKLRAAAFPLVVIGSNSILIYMSRGFIDYDHTANRLFGGLIDHAASAKPFWAALSVVATEWLLLYVLYRKKIFLRV